VVNNKSGGQQISESVIDNSKQAIYYLVY